jgi:hypothetical protein
LATLIISHIGKSDNLTQGGRERERERERERDISLAQASPAMSMRPPILLPIVRPAMPRNGQPLAQVVEGDAAAAADAAAVHVWVNGKGKGKQDGDEDGMGKGKGKFQKGEDGNGKGKFQKGEDGKGKGKFQKGKDKNGVPYKARPTTAPPHIDLGDEAGHGQGTIGIAIVLPIAAKAGGKNGSRSWAAPDLPPRTRSTSRSPAGSPDAV